MTLLLSDKVVLLYYRSVDDYAFELTSSADYAIVAAAAAGGFGGVYCVFVAAASSTWNLYGDVLVFL